MEKKSIDKWIYQGKKNCKNYVFFENKVLDLGNFMTQHPGGVKAIKNYIFKDVTNILFQVYPHDRTTTVNRLSKYQVGLIPQEQVKKPKQKTQKGIKGPDNIKEKKKVGFHADNQIMSASVRVNKHSKTQNIKYSQQHSRDKDNHQSITKSKSSKPKSKKKQNLTSIRLINEQNGKTYDDYFRENQQKIKQKQRAHTQTHNDRKQKGLNATCSFHANQIDEQKPNFRVPVLMVKHMNKNY